MWRQSSARARRARRFPLLIVLGLIVGVVSTLPAAGPSTRVVGPVAEAPDGASALLAARRQGSRVAIVADRSPTREVFANPDGTMAAELAVAPQRVKHGDTWARVDTTIGARPDGGIGPKAALGDLSLSRGGSRAPLARMTKDGNGFTVFWPGELPVPTVDGSTVTYAEVLPGVDLVIRAEVNGYRQELVIKSAEAARNPALAEIRLRVETAGLRLTANEAGAVSAVDEAGSPVFVAPPSTMWDAGGKHGRVGVAVRDGSLILQPDPAWLTDPGLAFPVVVDPDMRTPDKSNWASVSSGNPTTPYWWTSPDPDGTAQVGNCWDGNHECNGIGVVWTYFQFDSRFAAGKHILDAALNMTVVHSPDCTARIHNVFIANGQIDTGTTWNNKPQEGPITGQATVPAVASGCTGAKNVGFTVGAGIGAITTYYLRANDENLQSFWRKFSPNDAKLSVHFNTVPNLPTDLSTDPPLAAPCHWCDGKSYVGDTSIRLRAKLSDLDPGELVEPFWHIYTNSTLEERGWGKRGTTDHDWQQSGAIHSTTVDLRSKDGATISWSLRNGDGTDGSNWANGPAFVVDQVGVSVPPTVASALYPEDNRWHGGVGVRGGFTFGANGVGDIDHFLYGWSDPPSTPVDAQDRLGGSATVALAPDGDGPRTLFVQSVDRAGHRSPTRPYRIYVRAGNGPLAQWSFDGNANDSAFLGDHNGTPAGGVSYVPGAVGTAARLDGATGSAVSAPTVVHTDASFSISAWVRPDQLVHGMGVGGQDGTQVSGWYLSYRSDINKWVFTLPKEDVAAPMTVAAAAPQVPQAGVWTHLAGVVDRSVPEIRLYVNGDLAARAAIPADFVPWNAGGPMVVGRQKWSGAVGDWWTGGLDEVQVYDRSLTDAEVKATVSRDSVQVGHWAFDDHTGTTARNAVEGGTAGVLSNGAAFTGQGAVAEAVRLDGVDDVVSTGEPAVRTDQSFAVAAWVKADRLGTASATAISQDGTQNSGFALRYDASTQRWVFCVLDPDSASPTTTSAVATQQPQIGQWVHLAGVYDATAAQLRVYVNGELGGTVSLPSPPKNATGPFTMGRGRLAGNPADYWPGALDEVRVYARAISEDEVRGIVSQNSVTAGTWALDGNTNDTSGFGRNGTVGGTIDWSAGQTTSPDPTDLAVKLGGSGDVVSAPHTVDTDRSFSVAAWARLDRAGGAATVVSEDGTHASGFRLQALADGSWAFSAAQQDTAQPTWDQVRGGPAQIGVWTQLVGFYSKERQRIELYVNGVLVGSVAHTTGFNSSGGLQIGRGRVGDVNGDYFVGAIDDVSAFNRALFADEIRVMAGRDLALVHNWQLDESGGVNAADSVGTRAGVLGGGAAFGPGRVGNSVRLDGVNDAVTTTGVDVRTDQSFTVSAWVNLDSADRTAVAVSIDDAQTSKFRLGNVFNVRHPEGAWTFEMPESTGQVTEAAVSVLPSDIGAWTHLVGVYDAANRKVWLYVNGDRIDDGTLNTPWQASGGLVIGRGKVAGNPAQFWPGSVDDVRLYTTPLDKNRISALYRSYPAPVSPPTLPAANAGNWKFDENTGTVAADSSILGRDATLSTGAGWHGGLVGSAGWFNGTSGYAATSGPVLNTGQSFSVGAWAYPGQLGDGTRAILGQDGNRVSSFLLERSGPSNKWVVRVPTADQDNAQTIELSSAEPVAPGAWTHLMVVYDVAARQLRLYVNGVLSGVQRDVTILASSGAMSFGRARWNGAPAEFFSGGIDEVRAFDRALSDGEARKVHDDVSSMQTGYWRFNDGTPRDWSWLQNPTTVSGGTSYVPGVNGQALQLDGTTGAASGSIAAVPMTDSFTVSAWAKLARMDRIQTVVGQDGARMSGFVLQYRPDVNRWVFGAPTQDADSTALVAASSTQAPTVNVWTHLAGVYDYPSRQLRLYVDGRLVGSRSNALLWRATGALTIGRGKFNGAAAQFFAGAIDEVETNQFVTSDAEIARHASWPTPQGGQLADFVNGFGDHYTDHTDKPVRDGYHFVATLGVPAAQGQANTRTLYACVNGNDAFSTADPNCEGSTKVGDIGLVYTQQPVAPTTIPIYRCLAGSDHFESTQANCGGTGTPDPAPLGYTVAAAQLVRYYDPTGTDHWATTNGTPPGYAKEGTLAWVPLAAQPSSQPLLSCLYGSDEFTSTSATCENQRVVTTIGNILTQPPTNRPTVAIYRCTIVFAVLDHFDSTDPNCEGQTVEFRLGYLLTTPTF